MSTRTEFLYLLGDLFKFAERNQIEIIIFTFYRSPAQQEQEFLKGKSKLRSDGPHEKWLAIDLAIIEKGQALFDDSKETVDKYKELGIYWKSLDPNCIWGGDFNFAADVYHFELKKEK